MPTKSTIKPVVWALFTYYFTAKSLWGTCRKVVFALQSHQRDRMLFHPTSLLVFPGHKMAVWVTLPCLEARVCPESWRVSNSSRVSQIRIQHTGTRKCQEKKSSLRASYDQGIDTAGLTLSTNRTDPNSTWSCPIHENSAVGVGFSLSLGVAGAMSSPFNSIMAHSSKRPPSDDAQSLCKGMSTGATPPACEVLCFGLSTRAMVESKAWLLQKRTRRSKIQGFSYEYMVLYVATQTQRRESRERERKKGNITPKSIPFFVAGNLKHDGRKRARAPALCNCDNDRASVLSLFVVCFWLLSLAGTLFTKQQCLSPSLLLVVTVFQLMGGLFCVCRCCKLTQCGKNLKQIWVSKNCKTETQFPKQLSVSFSIFSIHVQKFFLKQSLNLVVAAVMHICALCLHET